MRTDTAAARAQPGAPDVILFAVVEARSVRFNSPPRAHVRFCWSEGGGDTLRVVERRNLPSPIVPGVTYRDVYIAVELRGHLNPSCLFQGRVTSDTTGPGVTPSALAACAAISVQPSAQPDSPPRPPS